MIYMDAAATAPADQQILQTVWPLLTNDFGNPSSRHELGASAARALDYARTTAAGALGVRGSDVVFTSGGTESNNLALKGLALAAPRGRHVVISAVEHSSVHRAAADLERYHGFEISVVGVDPTGRVDPVEVERVVREDTTLVSVMAANNEVGTLQPIAGIAAAARSVGALMHTDAVQAAAWVDLPSLAADVDALSISGHKLGGLKGAGLLMVRSRHALAQQISGGDQERGRRSGTENVAGAVATAVALSQAATAAAEDDGAARRYADYLRDAVVQGVGERAVPTGHPEHRVPGIVSFCFPGTSGEAVLLELERRGVLCSSGSACHADSDEPSPVLLAMGYEPDVALTSVRLSFGRGVKESEITQTARAVVAAVQAV